MKNIQLLIIVLLCTLASACSLVPDMGQENERSKNTVPNDSLSDKSSVSNKVDSPKQASEAVLSLLTLAKQQVKQKNWLAASQSIERAIRIEPRFADSYYYLAEVRFAQGKLYSANSLAKKSMSLGLTGRLKKQALQLVKSTES